MTDLIQGSEAWAEARARCTVTASALPSLFGVGYDSRMALWESKALMKHRPVNEFARAAMARGSEMEAEARNVLTARLERPIQETGFWVHPDMDWVGASPDGIIRNAFGQLEVVECKCPLVIESIQPWNDKWFRYRLQLELQMRCAGAVGGHLFIYHPEQGDKYWYERPDSTLWRLALVEMRKFKRCVDERKPPPPHTKQEKAPILAFLDDRRRKHASASMGAKREQRESADG